MKKFTILIAFILLFSFVFSFALAETVPEDDVLNGTWVQTSKVDFDGSLAPMDEGRRDVYVFMDGEVLWDLYASEGYMKVTKYNYVKEDNLILLTEKITGMPMTFVFTLEDDSLILTHEEGGFGRKCERFGADSDPAVTGTWNLVKAEGTGSGTLESLTAEGTEAQFMFRPGFVHLKLTIGGDVTAYDGLCTAGDGAITFDYLNAGVETGIYQADGNTLTLTFGELTAVFEKQEK